MAKPMIKPIPAFDSSTRGVINFVWNGASVYNNKIIIYDADTQVVVYEHEYSENYYALNHEVPPKTLQNNRKYAVQIQVIDVNDNRSVFSDKVYFWTADTPVINITNLSDGDVINSSSLTIEASYENTITEDLLFIRYHLYDSNKRLLKETDEDRSCSMNHTFKALENNTSYFIRITGLTIHEMEVDTGYIGFSVSYRNPNSYARIYAENNPATGFVHYKSNVVVISPDVDNTPQKEYYTYDVGYIDLTSGEEASAFKVQTPSDIISELSVQYTDDEGQLKFVSTQRSDEGITVHNYNRINKIRLYGSTSSKKAIRLGELNPLLSINSGNFLINDELIEHTLSGFELKSLPMSVADYYEVDLHGNRQITSLVGSHRFSSRDKAILISTENGHLVTYYDFDGKIGGLVNDLYCDGIPVNVDNQTSISLDSETGYIKIIWREDSNVTTETEAQEYFAYHSPIVFFPLQSAAVFKLDNKQLPSMVNQTFLRYSKNFVIPWDASAFVFKIKQCRTSADLFKVSKGEQICFLVSSRVDEENEFRIKLTVFGEGGSNYTMYSDVIECDYFSVIYVAIKRINGIYGLYVNSDASDEQTAGLWLSKPAPTYNLKPYDAWIDIDDEAVYVDTVAQMVAYQHNEPDDVEQYTIWIGDEV